MALIGYKAYKPSGAQWLKDIPAHWACQKLKTCFTERREKVSDREYMPLSVTKAGVMRQLGSAVKSSDGDNRKLCLKGDFVINSRSDRKGAGGIAPYDGSVSLISIVLTPRGIDERYAHYLLRSASFSEEFYKSGRGIVSDLWTTRYDEMRNILIPLPPLKEQEKIARYLDHRLSRLSRLLSLKKKVLRLLKEQQFAMIEELMRPPAKRDGGGENGAEQPEPKGWKWVRNKDVFALRREPAASGERHTLLSLTTRGVIARDIESGKGKFPSDFSLYQMVYPGDFVFCLFDIDETPRTVGVSALQGMITGAYTVLTPRMPQYSDFLYYCYLLTDHKKALRPLYTGLRKVISPERFLRAAIALPPPLERDEIVRRIKMEEERIEEKAKRLQKEIALLTELCAALIDDAVTGRVDVRQAAVPEGFVPMDTPEEDSAETGEAADAEGLEPGVG